MKVYMFLYDNFADFEITQVTLLLKEYPLVTVGFEKGLVKSYGGLKVHADIDLNSLDTNDVEIFIIPGGTPPKFIEDSNYSEKITKLNSILNNLNSKKKLIAAICGGPIFLTNSGILNGKRCTGSNDENEKPFYSNTIYTDADVEITDNIITAKGQAFTEFAVEIAKKVNIIKSDDEAIETINWLKNNK
ncbi:MAG: DJ-1/PfpI family protein [Candidatus Thorarchaeota archaeon]